MNSSLNRYKEKTFLIADDFAQFRTSLKQMLILLGANHIDQASDGKEAIELYQEVKHDILLIDFNLGDGPNGLQVLEELSNKEILRKDTIVIMVTAETSTDMVAGALAYRPDEYLAKPFTKSTLKSRLDKIYIRKEAIKPINLALNRKNYRKAISACDELITANSRYKADCIKIKADCLLHTGLISVARTIYAEVLQDRPVSWAISGLAKCELYSGNYEKAIELADMIIGKNRFDLMAWDIKIESLLNSGQHEDAAKIIKEANDINGTSEWRQRLAGQLSLSTGDVEGAFRAYRRLMSMHVERSPSDVPDFVKLSRSLLLCSLELKGPQGRRNVQEFKNTVKNGAAFYPHDPLLPAILHLHSGIFLSKTEREEEAFKMLAKAKDVLDSQDTRPYRYVMEELIFSHTILPDQEHIMLLRENYLKRPHIILTDNNPDKAQKYNLQGLKLFKQQEFLAAFRYFREGLSFAPQNMNIVLNLMQAMMKAVENKQVPEESDQTLDLCYNCVKNTNNHDHRVSYFKTLFKSLKSHPNLMEQEQTT